jgi:hypothetical protein
LDNLIIRKGLTSRFLSGIVRALATWYGFSVSGRMFDEGQKKVTVMVKHRPLQKELQAF